MATPVQDGKPATDTHLSAELDSQPKAKEQTMDRPFE